MSSIAGIYGSIMQGITAKDTAKRNADLMIRQANYELEKTGEQIVDIKNKERMVIGAQRAKIGASGVKLDGSPSEALIATETQAQTAIDRLNYWSGVSWLESMKGASYVKQAGQVAFANGIMSAAGKLTSYGAGIYKASQDLDNTGMWSGQGGGWGLSLFS